MKNISFVVGLGLLGFACGKPPTPINHPPIIERRYGMNEERSEERLSNDPDLGVKIEAQFKVENTVKEKCGEGMVFVEGEWCPEIKEEYDAWLDPPGTKFARCKKFKPTTCVSKTRVHKEFCIDVDEYTEPGETLPKANVSWEQAKSICEEHDKRLCGETEWTYACEKGEDDSIHAHTTGLERPSDVCNIDLMNLLDERGKLRDYRKPSNSLAQCTNPTTKIRNANGNLDEWTVRDYSVGPHKSALKGGWWMCARERCRPSTVEHGERDYWSISVSFRCCSDAN